MSPFDHSSLDQSSRPVVAVTLGDVAGIGPEVAVKAALRADVREGITPILVGPVGVVRRTLDLVGNNARIREVSALDRDTVSGGVGVDELVCVSCGEDAVDVPAAQIDPRAGKAAFLALNAAIDAALSRQVDAIVTAPIHKVALRQAGYNVPGHTEIFAERCGAAQHAMMLHLPATDSTQPYGLSVAHVTLHTSIRSVPDLLTGERIADTIELMERFVRRLGSTRPRIGVCALNPHGGEGGLFGDEETTLITAGIERARVGACELRGPFPADTLFKRAAIDREFDGIVAMYHDQGHIAFKLLGFDRAVNVTLGLPIVRTSPSHGTAFDIAWTGRAREDGMVAALQTATRLVGPISDTSRER